MDMKGGLGERFSLIYNEDGKVFINIPNLSTNVFEGDAHGPGLTQNLNDQDMFSAIWSLLILTQFRRVLCAGQRRYNDGSGKRACKRPKQCHDM